MAAKRKRKDVDFTKRTYSKRQKHISRTSNSAEPTSPSGNEPDIALNDQGDVFYEIRDIIGERKNEYLIDWKDDPLTGKSYQPTWEPKENANEEAIVDWEKKKQDLAAGGSARKRAKKRDASAVAEGSPARSEKPRQNGRRNRLVIDSSPERTGQAAEGHQDRIPQPSVANEKGLAEVEDSVIDRELASGQEPHVDLAVEISQRSPSHREQFQPIASSQGEQALLLESESSPQVPPSGTDISLQSPRLQIVPTRPSGTLQGQHRVIPDSQSLLGSSPPEIQSDQGIAEETFLSRPIADHFPSASRPLEVQAGLASGDAFTGTQGLNKLSEPDPRGGIPVSDAFTHIDSSTQSLASGTVTGPARAKSTDSAYLGALDLRNSPSVSPAQQAVQADHLASRAEPSGIPFESQDATTSTESGDLPASEVRKQLDLTCIVETPFRESPRALGNGVDDLFSSSRFSQVKEYSLGPILESYPTSLQQQQSIDTNPNQPEALEPSIVPSIERDDSIEDVDNVTHEAEVSTGERGAVQLSQPSDKAANVRDPSLGIEQQTSTANPAVFRDGLASPSDRGQTRPWISEVGIQLPSTHTSGTGFAESRTQNSDCLEVTDSRQLSRSSIKPTHNSKDLGFNSQRVEKIVDSVGEQSRPEQLFSADISSSIPPPPSQLPEISQSFRSSRPGTPKEDMSDNSQPAQTPSDLSLRERLKNMRAASASRQREAQTRTLQAPSVAERTLQVAGELAKSPSAIPDRSPQAASLAEFAEVEPPKLEFPAPAATDTPYSPVNISQSSSLATLGELALDTEEYVVPLPMTASVKDQYQQIIYNDRESVELFARTEEPDSDLVKRIEKVMDRVNRVTVHLDLDNDDTLTQGHVRPEEEAQWAEACSAKFQFLGRFLDLCREEERHIAILAQHDRILDILETFLKGKHVSYSRLDSLCRSEGSELPLTVTLIPTGRAGKGITVDQADLIIAFDKSFNGRDEQLQGLRANDLKLDRLSPVVHLMVINSAEHIDRCISSALSGIRRLRVLTSLTAQTRFEVGKLPAGYPDALAAADEVSRLWKSGSTWENWPLLPMPGITGIEIPEQHHVSCSSTQALADPTQMSLDLHKRHLDDDDSHGSSVKKAKVDPAISARLATGHAATEDYHAVSGKPASHSETAGYANIASPDMLPQAEGVKELKRKLAILEEEKEKVEKELRKEYSRKEADLRSHLGHMEERVEEYAKALDELQYRFEDQRHELNILREERDAALAGKAQMERRVETMASDVGKLKEERSALWSEVKEAKAALHASATPEVAELEDARSEAKQALIDKANAEKRLESMRRDFEFTREQYQAASTAAADAASEASNLRQENEMLRREASEQALRLRQLSIDSAIEQHVARIGELESTLSQTENLLRRKEELKIQARGRGMTTRASSVPRSPKSYSRPGSPNPVSVATGRRSFHPLRKEELRRSEGP